MQDNRAILLTPPGGAAIAVLRLIGPRCSFFLQKHFSRRGTQGRCVHGEIADGGRVIDDAVVVLSEDGRYADVNVHGGPWVVRSVLELARQEGFGLVEHRGGALPEDAADGNTPLEREMLAWLPMARTEMALRLLLAQPDAWNEYRLSPSPTPDQIESILADRSLHWLLNAPRVAIIGGANVGKSTLANQLFAQERSITADLPGTTRDWVGEIANIDGLAILLMDTPGVRPTQDDIERAAIERSTEQVRQADLVVVVLDATVPLVEQSNLLAEHPQAIRVINKIDRPAVWNVDAVGGIRSVATTGTGVGELRLAIRRRFGCEVFDIARPRWWTERQREILERAVEEPAVLRLL